jgi:hypothetical protein
MAYPLPTAIIDKWSLEYLPQSLLNFESGVNDSMTNNVLAEKLSEILVNFWVQKFPTRFSNYQTGVNWQSKYNLIQNQLSNMEKIDSQAAQFLKWQFNSRLSAARLSNFTTWQRDLSASRSGGITDQFSGFVDRTNIIEIGAAAVLGAVAVAAVPAIGAAVATTGAALPTASSIGVPSLGTIGTTLGAAAVDEAKKNLLNTIAPKENIQVEQPIQSVKSEIKNDKKIQNIFGGALISLAGLLIVKGF